jgi:hypothetical protein
MAQMVKVNTPGPARDQQRLVLRDKPRDEASMRGWRIEVDYYLADLESGETFWVERANGEEAQLSAREFILSPKCVPPGDTVDCDVAAADPLFEAIYVSRELTGDEADTLRRLMAEDVARERERERHPLLMVDSETRGVHYESVMSKSIAGLYADLEKRINDELMGDGRVDGLGFWSAASRKEMARDPARVPVGVCTGTAERDGETLYTVQIGAPVMAVTEAEREQRKAKMREAIDAVAANPNCVTFAVYDGLRHWSCPKCKVMIGDFAIESRAFKHHCGFDSEAPATPRVPKVGDEIEVLPHGFSTWQRTEVIEYGYESRASQRCGEHTGKIVSLRTPVGWVGLAELGTRWRWPEAKG